MLLISMCILTHLYPPLRSHSTKYCFTPFWFTFFLNIMIYIVDFWVNCYNFPFILRVYDVLVISNVWCSRFKHAYTMHMMLFTNNIHVYLWLIVVSLHNLFVVDNFNFKCCCFRFVFNSFSIQEVCVFIHTLVLSLFSWEMLLVSCKIVPKIGFIVNVM